jgi:hypothetical protein
MSENSLIKGKSRIVIERSEKYDHSYDIYIEVAGEEVIEDHPIINHTLAPVNSNPQTRLADGLGPDELLGILVGLIDTKGCLSWLKTREQRRLIDEQREKIIANGNYDPFSDSQTSNVPEDTKQSNTNN